MKRFDTYIGALSVSLLLIVRSSIALSFEHSFDGVTFTDAGSLMGDMYKDSTLELQRLPASEMELAKLQELISRDGFYTVKVSSQSGLPVTASVRASCLNSEALNELATVHIDEHGALVSLTYSVTSPSCGSAPPPAPLSSATQPLSHLSRPLTVIIDTPTFSPVLESTVAPPPPLSGPSALLNNFGASLESAISGGASAGSAAGATKDGKAPPVPDNRSWLAKNWMFVLGACMMAFNIITRTSGAPPAAAGAARPAVGAAPRR